TPRLIAPASPTFYPLSLHDALPISPAFLRPKARSGRSATRSSRIRAPRWRVTPAQPRCRRAPAPGRASGGRAVARPAPRADRSRSEEHTSELQSLAYLVCRLLLEKK